jgi:plasmid stabilization system protein ParE
MFTHPALLRQLTLCADHLRRGGETAWARRVVQAADSMRKLGWTDAARAHYGQLFEGEAHLDTVGFGSEHERRLGGPQGVAEANARLAELKSKIKELASHPTKEAPDPELRRQRSPDLG